MSIPAHPAANLFPLLSGPELEALAEDIHEHGLHHPIVMFDGQVLDGRNRLAACELADVEPTFNYYDGDDPIGFVVSENLKRRHLNESQRGMVARRAAELRQGARTDIGPIGTKSKPSQAEAAALLNVGERTVKRAGVVLDHGVPELIGAVDRGAVAVSTAADVATLPAPEQAVVVAKGEAEILKVAKEIRAKRREARRVEVVERLESIESIEAKAAAGVYDVLVIDPPWAMEKIERDERPNQVAFDYPTMNEAELAALDLPMADACHVWVWTTHKHLPMALRLLDAWGLSYVCTFVWHKPGGFQPVGLPQYNCEFALYARRGSPQFVDTKAFPVCFDAPREGHSVKPDAFYDVVRRVTAGRRLDMFNRRPIDGFDGWGKEASDARMGA